jgi:hypothetical protein
MRTEILRLMDGYAERPEPAYLEQIRDLLLDLDPASAGRLDPLLLQLAIWNLDMGIRAKRPRRGKHGPTAEVYRVLLSLLDPILKDPPDDRR